MLEKKRITKNTRVTKSTIASALSGWSITYVVFPYVLLLLGLTPPGWIIYSIAGIAAFGYAVTTAISKSEKFNNEENRGNEEKGTIKGIETSVKELETKLKNLAARDIELYKKCQKLQSLEKKRDGTSKIARYQKFAQDVSQLNIHDDYKDTQESKFSKLDIFRIFKTGITAATVAWTLAILASSLLLGISGGLPLLICAGVVSLVYGVIFAYTKQKVIKAENKLNNDNNLQLFSNDGSFIKYLLNFVALSQHRNKATELINIESTQNSFFNNLNELNKTLQFKLQFSIKNKAQIVKSGFMHATTGWAVSCIILSIFVIALSVTPVGWLTYAIGGVCALSFAISGILSKNNHLHWGKSYETKHLVTTINLETKISDLNHALDNEIDNVNVLINKLGYIEISKQQVVTSGSKLLSGFKSLWSTDPVTNDKLNSEFTSETQRPKLPEVRR
jgi:hypothetical protein